MIKTLQQTVNAVLQRMGYSYDCVLDSWVAINKVPIHIDYSTLTYQSSRNTNTCISRLLYKAEVLAILKALGFVEHAATVDNCFNTWCYPGVNDIWVSQAGSLYTDAKMEHTTFETILQNLAAPQSNFLDSALGSKRDIL